MKDVKFIRVTEYRTYVPELQFTVLNQTSSFWNRIDFQFEIDGLCGTEQRHWSFPVFFPLGYADDHQVVHVYRDTQFSLAGKIDGCTATGVAIKFISAISLKVRIEGRNPEITIDLAEEARLLKEKKDAEQRARDAERQARVEKLAREEAEAEARQAVEQEKAATEERKRQAKVDAAIKARRDMLSRSPKLDAGTPSVAVAVDRKCLDQAVAAINGEGVEARKALQELIRYACVFLTPRGTPITVNESDGKHTAVTVLDGAQIGKSGWVLNSWIQDSAAAKTTHPGSRI